MKKKIILLFSLCIFFAFAMPVHADVLKSPKITSMHDYPDGYYPRIEWEMVEGADYYNLYMKENGTWKLLIKLSYSHLMSMDTEVVNRAMGFRYNKYYTLAATAVNEDGESPIDEEGQNFIIYKNQISCKNTKDGIQLSWSKNYFDCSYDVYRNGVFYKTINDGTSTSFLDTNVKSNTYYNYTLLTHEKKDGQSVLVNCSSNFIYCIKSPKLTSVKSANKSITVRWKKVSKADFYLIYYKTTDQKRKIIKVCKNKLSCKIKNLKKGKKYLIKVKSCMNNYGNNITVSGGTDEDDENEHYDYNDKITSAWSLSKTIKVK